MNKLKELRKNLKLTQADIANKLGIDRTSYCKYESGEVKPPLDILIKLANYFNTSIDYIVGHESEVIDLDFYPDYKKDLIKLIIKLGQLECERITDFTNGILEAKQQYESFYERNK